MIMWKIRKTALNVILYILFCNMLLISEMKATHFMGGEITYQCLGGNNYKISLTVYRDCNSGASFEDAEAIKITTENCNGFEKTVALEIAETFPMVITPLCDQVVDACDSPQGAYGVQQFKYEANVDLPNNCEKIIAAYRNCCRSAAISTLLIPANEDYYIGAVINTKDVNCNSSPTFNNNPTPFSCVGQEVNYNHGVTDLDGDELVFSLVDCSDALDNPVEYADPFSGTNPLLASNISIDPGTGAISFVPTALQVGIICVMVEEFRNGIKIGEVVRDIQFTVLNCGTNTIDENILPILSGMDGTADASGTTGSFNTSVCFDIPVCFEVEAFDLDGHLLELSWNESLDGATFIVTGNGTTSASAEFCWTPTADDTGLNFFTLTVLDDACNIRGSNTYTFSIDVIADVLDFDYVQDTVSCIGGNDGSASITINQSLSNPTITWPTTPPQSGLSASNLTAGTYQVIVEDASLTCPKVPIEIVIADHGQIEITLDSLLTKNISCGGYSDGTLSVNVSGGRPPYQFLWSNNETGLTIDNLTLGTYTLTVIDSEGCEYSNSFSLTEPDPIVLNYVTSDYNGFGVSCRGGNDGFINLSPSGGTAPYMIAWSTGSNDGNLADLMSGNYQVTVTDAQACVDTLDILLSEPSSLNSTLSSLPTTCYDNSEGTIIIENINGGVPDYGWSFITDSYVPIDTFPVHIGSQSRGEKIIYFQDDVGCIYQDTVFVGSPDSLYVDVIPADTLMFLGEETLISFNTNSTDNYEFIWESNVPMECDSCPFFNYAPLGLTVFDIEITQNEYACKAYGQVIIRIYEKNFIIVQNVFTHNEDGFNDKLIVYGNSEAISNINYFRVFDRWGALVFEQENFQPNDISIGWDGTFGGKEKASAVFIYSLEVKYINNDIKLFSGDITLVR